MSVETVAHATVEQEVVDKAQVVYGAGEMTPDEAYQFLLVHTAADHAVPFDLSIPNAEFVPNAETIEAMEAGRRGETTRVNSIDELFELLHAEDWLHRTIQSEPATGAQRAAWQDAGERSESSPPASCQRSPTTN